MPGQPQNTPVVQKPTPIVLDQLLIETSDSNKALYDIRLEVGHLHPDQIKYPGHVLLKHQVTQYGQVQYTWGNSFTSQDSYNVAKQYLEDSAAHPIFIRSYRVLRSDYLVTGTAAGVSGTRGQPFTGIVAINVTNGGTGYTKDFAIGFTGGAGSGLAGIAITNRGVVVRVEINNVGTGYTSAPSITFANGSGTGAAATAIIQPTTALLIKEELMKLPEDDPYYSLYDRLVRVYETLPGPVLTGTAVSEQVRGLTVTTTEQVGYSGTLSPSTGSGIIQSSVVPQSSTVDKKTTVSVSAGSLPSEEVIGYFAFVPLPLLLFDIVNTIFCDGGPFFTLVSNPETSGGSSVLRKHRKTITYHATQPNLDLSGSTFVTADIRYQGKVISFSYGNVLNDAISYNEDFITSSGPSACGWTEAYDFDATAPSATDFLAGAWYTRDYDVVPWGVIGYKSTLIEYYSAEGNPAI